MGEPKLSSSIAPVAIHRAAVSSIRTRARAQGAIDAIRFMAGLIGEGWTWQQAAESVTRSSEKRLSELEREEREAPFQVLEVHPRLPIARVREGESEYCVPLSLLRERRGDRDE